MVTDPIILSVPQSDGTVRELYRSQPKQTAFHLATEPYVLMEGCRGTGKSLCGRMHAHMLSLQYPGFKYLILRRTMGELRKSHLDFIDAEMEALGGFYHHTDGEARYPNGSKGFFSHCETEADILKFLSSQFGWIFFDELTTFTQKMYSDISSSARVPVTSPYKAQVGAGTNPIGEGASWVKSFFILKNVNLAQFQDYDPRDYRAIHLTLDDNAYIDKKAYAKQFSGASAFIRAAWLEGEWRESDGYFADWQPRKLVDEQPVDWHVITELPTVKGKPLLSQPWISVYRALDWGFSPNPAVCLWIAVLPNGRAIVFKERHWHKTAASIVAKDIVKDSVGMKVVDTFADPSMFMLDKATEGQSLASIVEQNGVPLTMSINDRIACGHAIHEWLNTEIDQKPKLQVLDAGCPSLVRTLPEMRQDKSNPQRIADGEDDWVISLGYFCQSSITASRDPEKPAIPRWMRPTSRRRVLGANNVRTA